MASEESVMSKKLTLYNGVQMPAVGINTYRVRSEEEVYEFVDSALDAGYRLFDTAAMFGNEVPLKHAFRSLLPKYGLERSDIFITSKMVTRSKANYASIKRVFQRTLNNLGLDYLDLYLINYPSGSTLNRKNTWRALQALYDEGCVLAIGVSNHKVYHLRQLVTAFSAPMVNQIEWNPLTHDEELYSYCQRHDIVLQAYSPFGTPFASEKRLFRNPVIRGLASKYDATVAQVLLMWSLQKRVGVLPVATNKLHMMENINMNFKLSIRDMDLVDAIAPDDDSPDTAV